MKPEVGNPPLPADPSQSPSHSHRRWGRPALFASIAVVAVLVSATAVQAARVGHELRSGREALGAVLDDPSTDRSLEERSATALRRFRSAQDRARSPWLGLWSRLPGVGRPARWVRSVADAGVTLATKATEAARRLDPLLTRAGSDAAARVTLLEAVERELTDLQRIASRVHVGSPGLPVPPFASLGRDVTSAFARVRASIEDGIVGVRGLRSFLGGPTRYLVLAGNNAEMRAGGMALQAGTLFAGDGRIVAGGFEPTGNLLLPASVPLPAELSALYGWLDPGREWRNTGTSPNFPVVAPVYAAMVEAAGKPTVDGVLQLDVVALRHLLRVIGPIEVRGQRFDASNIERTVMHDLYVDYGPRQVRRRADLSLLAAETFRALSTRSFKPTELAAAVRDAAAGRHLLAWSRKPEQQTAWRRLRVHGGLERDGLMLTVQNHGGDKLDWFVRPSVRLRRAGETAGRARWAAEITIDNPTPVGEPAYVAGNGSVRPPGTYHGFVALYLPGWAADVEVSGADARVVGTDGPMRVVGVLVDVPRGGRTSLTVRYSVPGSADRMVLLPSARAAPIRVDIEGRLVDDRKRLVLAF